MFKNLLNYKVSFERLSIYFCLFWLSSLVVVFFFLLKKYEVIYSNYVSFLLLCIVILIINILNINFRNHLISLLNICFLIFYIPKIFFISISPKSILEYLATYPEFFTFINQLTLQYFVLSSCILVFFLNVNFKDILNIKNTSKIDLNLSRYTYIFFFISLFLIFQNLFFKYLSTLLPVASFLQGSTYMILRKVFDVDIFIFLYVSSLFFRPFNKKIIFLSLILFSLYIFNGLYFLGNRSTPLQIILNFVFLMVLIGKIYKLELKFIFFSILSLPIFAIYFSIAGAARKYFLVEKVALNCSKVLHCYKNNDLKYFPEYYMGYFFKDGETINYLKNIKGIIIGIIDRISYFDFYLINMSNAEIITDKIPLTHYFKSIVDKLSPGFDFYGVPLIKNLLYSVFYGFSSRVSNSSQFTFFAENQVMFNYFYIILIIFFSLVFRFFIQFVQTLSFFSFRLFGMIFIYQLYWLYLTGFGYDYFIVKTAYTLLFLIIFFAIIYKYEKN